MKIYKYKTSNNSKGNQTSEDSSINIHSRNKPDLVIYL